MALVGGMEAPTDRVMGHAGAIIRDKERETAQKKFQKLEEAGVILTDHPEKFGNTMKQLLTCAPKASSMERQARSPFTSRKRQLHTAVFPSSRISRSSTLAQQRRRYKVELDSGVDLSPEFQKAKLDHTQLQLHYSVNRSTYKPTVRISGPKSRTEPPNIEFTYPYSLEGALFKKDFIAQLEQACKTNPEDDFEIFKYVAATEDFVEKAWHFAQVFKKTDAAFLAINAGYDSAAKHWCFNLADADFDGSAQKSSQRQAKIYGFRDTSAEIPEAVEAEKYGIVYVRLPGEGNIGTLGRSEYTLRISTFTAC